MELLCYRAKLLVYFALESGFIGRKGRMLMVRIASLEHVVLLVELGSSLVAPNFHGF